MAINRTVVPRWLLISLCAQISSEEYAKKNYERVVMKLTTIPLSLKVSIAFSLYEMVDVLEL